MRSKIKLYTIAFTVFTSLVRQDNIHAVKDVEYIYNVPLYDSGENFTQEKQEFNEYVYDSEKVPNFMNYEHNKFGTMGYGQGADYSITQLSNEVEELTYHIVDINDAILEIATNMEEHATIINQLLAHSDACAQEIDTINKELKKLHQDYNALANQTNSNTQQMHYLNQQYQTLFNEVYGYNFYTILKKGMQYGAGLLTASITFALLYTCLRPFLG